MNKLLFTVIFSVIFLTHGSLYSASIKDKPHFDKGNLPKGCGSCHKGHGRFNTPMLSDRKDTFCFRCHGDNATVEKTKSGGYLNKSVQPTNIQRVFEKAYHHPIERLGIHKQGETLPERDPSKPRHSECGDCHHHHFVTKENKLAGISGADKQGVFVERINFEYELCFKCHSSSANLPADQSNKARLFSTSNPSFHPVVGPGRNSEVPSLLPPLTATEQIKCTDCHNSDDSSGPKGPHGSSHRYILSKNFKETDGQESMQQYELCYSCHNRLSILNNDSFQYHSLHISTAGASCRTCHNPHGSSLYPHLIDFDNIVIRPSKSGRIEFIDYGKQAGQCYLNCHNKDHDPAMYPGNIPNPIPVKTKKLR